VIPLTFSQASHWYQNIRAAGSCIITYQGADHTLTAPVLVDRATAGPAYPRYERLALRLIGINEYVWLTGTPNQRTASAALSPPPIALVISGRTVQPHADAPAMLTRRPDPHRSL
jgi:hypothetical protein